MKKVLITGSKGQLVTDLIVRLKESGNYKIHCYDRQGCDVTDYDKLTELFALHDPDIYIHGPSVHNVEDIGKDINKACEVNIGSLLVASNLCNLHDCCLVNFSTNYVHSGKFVDLYNYEAREGIPPNQPAEPVNVYGITKAAGEKIVAQTCKRFYNIRVSGLFGKTGSRAKNNDNFIYIILRNLQENGEAEVVKDQTLNVTYTVDAVRVIERMFDISVPDGLYHVVNKGVVTWYDVAKFVAETMGYEQDVVKPITTEEFYSDVNRPQHTALSILETEQKLGIEIPSWQSGVVRFLREVGEIR
jgi:dTDP-4-dehydrorhamnose reductase